MSASRVNPTASIPDQVKYERIRRARLSSSRAGRYSSIPEDHETFRELQDKAKEVLQIASEFTKFTEQFQSLLNLLGKWAKENRSQLKKVYLTIRDSDLLFLVIQKRNCLDIEFEDRLSDLDLEVANNLEFDQIRLNVMALPNMSEDGTESFLAPYVLEYTGI